MFFRYIFNPKTVKKKKTFNNSGPDKSKVRLEQNSYKKNKLWHM